jgi:hypothetical protein
MRRLLFVPLLSLATVAALSLPALAKGPMESASGQVIITGPGLQRPIELKGKLQGFAEPGDGFIPTDVVVLNEQGQLDPESNLEFTAFLFESGLLSNDMGDKGGWYVLRPENLRAIGPAYQMRLDMTGEGWSDSVTRQLYPFAPERPLVFTPAESITVTSRSRMQNLRGLWWSAPPAMLAILHEHGLPLTAPHVEQPPPAPAPVLPQHPQGWLFLWAAIALLGLLVVGVVAGRRNMRVA